jgi:hypothetical protein
MKATSPVNGNITLVSAQPRSTLFDILKVSIRRALGSERVVPTHRSASGYRAVVEHPIKDRAVVAHVDCVRFSIQNIIDEHSD